MPERTLSRFDDRIPRRWSGVKVIPRLKWVCFFPILMALCAFGGTLGSTEPEWNALVTSAPAGTGSVVPIGTASYIERTSINVDVTPRAIAITPDGRTALVANQGSDDITVIDIASGSTSSVALPAGTLPTNIGITPDGRRAVVIGGTDPYGALVLDLTTSPISIEPSPFAVLFGTALAITPDGKRALVGGSSESETSISVLDLTTTPASFTSNYIPGFFDGGLAVTPDGSRAIAVTRDFDTATMIDLTATPNPVQIHIVSVGPSPFDVAITPDGKRALVLFAGTGYMPTGGITVLNLTTTPMSVQTLNVWMPDGFVPSAIAITPDGKKAVVTRNHVLVADLMAAFPSSDVIFFDLTTDPISLLSTPEIDVDTPTAVAITPDQAPTALFTYRQMGSVVTFDASASTSPIGALRHYHWKFGDGHKTTTTSPIVRHNYHEFFEKLCCRNKHIVARLTVTNTAGTSTEVTFTGKTVSNNGGPSAVCRHHLHFRSSSSHERKDPLVRHFNHLQEE